MGLRSSEVGLKESSSSSSAGSQDNSFGIPGGQERRRFFRLNDRIGVRVEPLGGVTYDVETEMVDTDSATPVFTDWKRQFAHWDAVLDEMGPELSHSTLGVAIKALRQQIKSLSAPLLEQDQLQQEYLDDNFDVKEVNISACGLGLYHHSGLTKGMTLSVSLSLGEGEIPVVTEATVVSVEPRCSELDYLRLDFDSIDNDSQERLIQYLVRRQSEQLRDKMKRNR